MADKERLDVLLLKLGHAESRQLAKSLIMSGAVYVDGQKSLKAGTEVPVLSNIEVRADKPKYVSRGGLKLERAINFFSLSLNGKRCLDIGASTGGFTDCMLKHGANSVISVDVGYGQLCWQLRNDSRVTVLEKTNARYLDKNFIKVPCEFASVDVSFISVQKILPVFNDVLTDKGEAVCLIKPQFECGRKYVGKHGVVKDKFVHSYVIKKVIEYGKASSLFVKGLTFSPIKGPKGNIEYLIYFVKDADVLNNGIDFDDCYLNEVVETAHTDLAVFAEITQ